MPLNAIDCLAKTDFLLGILKKPDLIAALHQI